MDTATRNALVMDNYGYWIGIVSRLRRCLPHLRRDCIEDLVQEAVVELLVAKWDGARCLRKYGAKVIENKLGVNFRYRGSLVSSHPPYPRDSPDMLEAKKAAATANHCDVRLGAIANRPEAPEPREAAASAARAALSTMGPAAREILKQAYGIDSPRLTDREVAERDGVRPKTVRKYRDRALATLRKKVAA